MITLGSYWFKGTQLQGVKVTDKQAEQNDIVLEWESAGDNVKVMHVEMDAVSG